MYQISRSIYRQLAPRIVCDGNRGLARQEILTACETTVTRMIEDGRYFAHPTRSLFEEIRIHFSLGDQPLVYRVVDRNLDLAKRYIERFPLVDATGQPRRCEASTRRGTACRREPLPGRDFCPSHKHLEQLFGDEPLVSDAA